MDYRCCALPGASNQTISRIVIDAVSKDNPNFVAIMWTFINRYEYYRNGKMQLVNLPMSKDDKEVYGFYKVFGLDDNQMLYSSIMSFLLVQEYLSNRKIPFIFTMADVNPFKKCLIVDGKMQPDRLLIDQDPVLKSLYNELDQSKWFWIDPNHTNDGFFDWAHRNYPVGPNKHPLEEAHARLADSIYPMALTLTSK